MKMTITKCDKCKKEMRENEGRYLRTYRRNACCIFRGFELCDKCYKELIRWLKNAK